MGTINNKIIRPGKQYCGNWQDNVLYGQKTFKNGLTKKEIAEKTSIALDTIKEYLETTDISE